MEAVPSIITLESSEGKQFTVPDTIMEHSQLIQNTIADSNDYHVKLPFLSSAALEKVVEYLEMHNYKPKLVKYPITSGDLQTNLPTKLDFDFVERLNGYDEQVVLLQAADYLTIKTLQQIIVCAIATEFYIDDRAGGLEAA